MFDVYPFLGPAVIGYWHFVTEFSELFPDMQCFLKSVYTRHILGLHVPSTCL
jgi:hypothetical protein